jgi:hypothetical protein
VAAGLRAVVAGVVLVTLYTFFFVFPGHEPKPNGLPVGVVGPAPAVKRAEAGLERGRAFDVRAFGDLDAARAAILDREVYGALELAGRSRVLVSSAASFQVAQLLPEVAMRAGVTRPQVIDVRSLVDEDPRGVSINLLVLSITVPAILGALVLMQMAPALDGPGRLACLGLFGLLSAIAAVLVARVGIGVIGGSFVALTGVIAVAIFAIAAMTLVLMLAFGTAGVAASFMVLLMLGNPGSGAASAPELLPDPWSWAGQLLPPGALATGVRNVAYFDAADAPMWLTVLLAYAVASAVIVLVVSRRSSPTP